MSAQPLPTVLITGASTGIGAVYADRFARRGHPLVLVARNAERLNALARRLRAETGVEVDVVVADLTDHADLLKIEARLRDDARIGVLVNNAGAAAHGGFAGADLEEIDRLIRLNVTAVTRLAGAVTPRLIAQRQGAIVNIASILSVAPEFPLGVYPATKAFVLGLTQMMQAELTPHGVYVQAVLPGGTRTEIWERSGRDVEDVPGLMEVDTLVDAALAGFDLKEPITFPTLADTGKWEALEAARKALLPDLVQSQPAARYLAVARAA